MPIVEFANEDGPPLLIQVETTPVDDLVTRGLETSTLIEKAERTFQAALAPIRTVAEAVTAELRAVSRQPDEVTVGFGLDFTASTSAVLASANATANVSVQLTWKLDPYGAQANSAG
jgi:Trypsin-co-occurring domain 1